MGLPGRRLRVIRCRRDGRRLTGRRRGVGRRWRLAVRRLRGRRGGGRAGAWSLAAAGRRGVTAAGDGADHDVDAEHRVDGLLEQVLVPAALKPLHVALAGEAEGQDAFVEGGHAGVADDDRGDPALGLDGLDDVGPRLPEDVKIYLAPRGSGGRRGGWGPWGAGGLRELRS